MDADAIRLLTDHLEDDAYSIVGPIVSEIAAALASQPAFDYEPFRADVLERAARQPELASCLTHLLTEIAALRRPRSTTGAGRTQFSNG
jgi:hypothetical protein